MMEYGFEAGFYLVKDDALLLGPFQGKVACVNKRWVSHIKWTDRSPISGQIISSRRGSLSGTTVTYQVRERTCGN